MKQLTFKVPNTLICDTALSLTARRVGVVLYSRRNVFGVCRKSLTELAELASCSVETVRKAVRQLSEAGYITAGKTYHYRKDIGTMVYGKTVYSCNLNFRGGYTKVPRSVFEQDLTASAFIVLLYLYVSAGNRSRSYPSLTKIMEAVGVVRSTVCLALQTLKDLSCLLVLNCRKVNRAFAANSYHFGIVLHRATAEQPVAEPEPAPPKPQPRQRNWFVLAFERVKAFFRSGGSPIFRKRCYNLDRRDLPSEKRTM